MVQLVAKSGTFYTPTLMVAYGGPTAEFYFWQTVNPHDDARLNQFTPHRALDVFGRRHTWISPDEYHFPWWREEPLDVVQQGGKVALGAHGQLQGLGPHWEIWAQAGVGGSPESPAMSPLDALRVATIDRGREDRLPAGPRIHRTWQAGRLRRARRQSARRHPRHRADAPGGQKRRRLRRVVDERDLAGRQAAA